MSYELKGPRPAVGLRSERDRRGKRRPRIDRTLVDRCTGQLVPAFRVLSRFICGLLAALGASRRFSFRRGYMQSITTPGVSGRVAGGSDRRPTIRFAPEDYGFGPLGKALHIARAIRGIAGDAVSLELLLGADTFRSPVDAGLFDRIRTDGVSEAERADAVVTIMNVKGIRAAAARGEKIYAVDSLAWLWNEPLPIQDLIHTYFYQDLPVLPVPPRNLARMPRPTPISAIGRLPGEAAKGGQSDEASVGDPRLVVSLSGLETPDWRLGLDNLWYPPYILDAFEHLADVGQIIPEKLALFGNTMVLRHFAGPRISRAVCEGTQSGFGIAARTAGVVACPPGLTTIVECLRAGIGLRLLPPQNSGQVKLMKTFVDAIGVPVMPWTAAGVRSLEHATLPEDVRTVVMRGIIAEERRSRDHADTKALLSLLEQDPPVPGAAAVAGLIGPGDGAVTVAKRLVSDLSQ